MATRACEQSFVLGSGATPLAVQTPALMQRYVQAVEKVVDNLDDLIGMDFETPITTREAALVDATFGQDAAAALSL